MITAKKFRNYHLNHAKKWNELHPGAKEPKPCFDYWAVIKDPTTKALFKKNNRNDGALRVFLKELYNVAENQPGEWVQYKDTYVMCITVGDDYVWTIHNSDIVAVLTKPVKQNHITAFYNATTGTPIEFREYVTLYEDIIGGDN